MRDDPFLLLFLPLKKIFNKEREKKEREKKEALNGHAWATQPYTLQTIQPYNHTSLTIHPIRCLTPTPSSCYYGLNDGRVLCYCATAPKGGDILWVEENETPWWRFG